MSKLKKKISNRLIEATVSPEDLRKNTDDLVTAAKDSLDIDDTQAKDYVSGFIGEVDGESVGRGIEYGVNPEVGADKYDAYRALIQKMTAEEEGGEQPVKEDDTVNGEPSNDIVKLKNDVAKVMAKLDMSSIAPYLKKIDNPTEQAEMIAQFAERIGVPKAKLGMVVAQLRLVAEGSDPKMTKNQLIETVVGKTQRNVIKTIKVKDIK